MCGIFGLFTLTPLADLQRRLATTSLVLRHRGPNDSGLECTAISGGILALGQTRLSIIDLSQAGHQPMYSGDGRFVIVYNGEIYNYRELRNELVALGRQFRSDSDTEVLIACWATWGERCLERLRGMFAMVIFDAVNNDLTMVRDAFGIKPLYYQIDSDGIYFASEIPALLRLLPSTPKLNQNTAMQYLSRGAYDHTDQTFYSGILQLKPGHQIKIEIPHVKQQTPRRWWWPKIQERSDQTLDDAADQVREMFLSNVRLHLRSDVPIGVALSGGVDSSAVVCAMRHIEPTIPIHTFSYVARDSPINEEKWADIINSYVGAVSHKIVVSPRELVVDLDDLIRTQGEPFGGTSIYAQYKVFKLAHDNGVTVTLDGQGADELLAGYRGYPMPRLRSLLERRQYGKVLQFMVQWAKWPGRSLNEISRMCVGLLLPPSLEKILRKQLSREIVLPEWLNAKEFFENISSPSGHCDELSEDGSNGRRLMETLRRTLAGDGLSALLRHGDRNSMRWSIESRVPFLTTDLAEYLLALPEDFLISQAGETKHVFRRAMRGIVPDSILDRRDKIGFSTPEPTWFKELRPTALGWLEALDHIPMINAEKARSVIKSAGRANSPFSSQEWRLLNYCRWAVNENIHRL
jgi:asparagine synthase (glutamine-hydrolysing)